MTVLGVTVMGELVIASDGNLYTFDILSQSRIEQYQHWDKEGQTSAIDCWREAVASGSTEQGFSDWWEDVMRYDDVLFCGHDDSWQWMVEEALSALADDVKAGIVDALNDKGGNDFADAEEVFEDFVSDARGWQGYNSLEREEMAYIANEEAFVQYGLKVAA